MDDESLGELEMLERVSRARAALGGFSPTDIVALVMVLVAIVLGFLGGLFFGAGIGFLVASGELLVVGIIAGFS